MTIFASNIILIYLINRLSYPVALIFPFMIFISFGLSQRALDFKFKYFLRVLWTFHQTFVDFVHFYSLKRTLINQKKKKLSRTIILGLLSFLNYDQLLSFFSWSFSFLICFIKTSLPWYLLLGQVAFPKNFFLCH